LIEELRNLARSDERWADTIRVAGPIAMIPEAFHNSPSFSGLLAAFGFGLLLLVDATTR
jgi:hypothetical protein